MTTTADPPDALLAKATAELDWHDKTLGHACNCLACRLAAALRHERETARQDIARLEERLANVKTALNESCDDARRYRDQLAEARAGLERLAKAAEGVMPSQSQQTMRRIVLACTQAKSTMFPFYSISAERLLALREALASLNPAAKGDSDG